MGDKSFEGEGFQFSRAFSLDVRICTEARSGFSMELPLEFSLKCSLEVLRDVTGALTGAFPAEFALEFALELALELTLELPLSNTFLYVVLTLSLRFLTFPYVKRER